MPEVANIQISNTHMHDLRIAFVLSGGMLMKQTFRYASVKLFTENIQNEHPFYINM